MIQCREPMRFQSPSGKWIIKFGVCSWESVGNGAEHLGLTLLGCSLFTYYSHIRELTRLSAEHCTGKRGMRSDSSYLLLDSALTKRLIQ